MIFLSVSALLCFYDPVFTIKWSSLKCIFSPVFARTNKAHLLPKWFDLTAPSSSPSLFQLRKAVMDHISDSFLETNVPLLVLIEAAKSGNEKEVKEYAQVFREHANKLVEVSVEICMGSRMGAHVHLLFVGFQKVCCTSSTLSLVYDFWWMFVFILEDTDTRLLLFFFRKSQFWHDRIIKSPFQLITFFERFCT